MKKWNWSLFFVIICISFIGALGNDSVESFKDAAILALSFGIPIGLLWAWTTKDEE